MSIATHQVPGVYRRRVGDVLVTALSDGSIVLPPQVFVGVSPEEAEAMRRAAGLRPPFAAAINTFMLQWPGKTVLVDTGTGGLMGPTTGQAAANLQAAGVAPEEVDAILMTHLHGDHFGGLVDASSKANFPRAELYVADSELAYWSDDQARAAAPEGRQDAFDRARRSVGAYGNRLHRFGDGELLPGVTAIAMPGHTPGHTGFMLTGPDERLVIWGDLMNGPPVQASKPEVSLVFDVDPALGAATRRRVLQQAVAEDWLVAGMHLPFPAFSHVARQGDGFVVQPEPWRALPA